MIRGLGCDLCGIARMEKAMENPRFTQRIFTEEEQRYIADHTHAAETAAGIFAAKEALVKAIGTGFRGLFVSDIAVTHDEGGRPAYIMNEKTVDALKKIGAQTAFVTISHDAGVAMAACVLE